MIQVLPLPSAPPYNSNGSRRDSADQRLVIVNVYDMERVRTSQNELV